MKLRNKKTGQVVDLEQWRFEYYHVSGCIAITNDKNQNEEFCYNSFAELNEEWEDAEDINVPLIKDERMRKAVRAWAEACKLKYVVYKQSTNEYYDPDTRGKFAIKFTLKPIEVWLEDGKTYTIAELCGEEGPRPVIADGVEYDSYEDYLKSREEGE